MIVSDNYRITEHAYDRAKERFGLSKKALDRLLTKVVVEGEHNLHSNNSTMIVFKDKKFAFRKNKDGYALTTVSPIGIYSQNRMSRDELMFKGGKLVKKEKVFRNEKS